jgi:hypothetical protein
MKYAIILYIALGLILSLAIGIQYHCEGEEMFPIYYGSPFIFMKTSLACSLEHHFSILGLVANCMVWSFMLFFIDKTIQILIRKVSKPKLIRISYNIIIVLMLLFSTFHIAINAIFLGSGFEKDLNYWYWDVDKEAKYYKVTCKGELILFPKSI